MQPFPVSSILFSALLLWRHLLFCYPDYFSKSIPLKQDSLPHFPRYHIRIFQDSLTEAVITEHIFPDGTSYPNKDPIGYEWPKLFPLHFRLLKGGRAGGGESRIKVFSVFVPHNFANLYTNS